MKNRRFTYIYILLAALLLAASYQFNYRDSKEAVQNSINEQFREAVPHWLNTIFNILQIPQGGLYDRAESVSRTKTTIIGAKDTIEISARYFPRTDYEWWLRKGLEGMLIKSDMYYSALTDSLFSNLLADMGIEAEAATELHVKNLKEMFPTADSMNVNAPIREVLVAKHVEGFVTDTVGIGICDQGLMVGKVALERHTILANMRWLSRWQIALALLLAAGYAVAAYYRKVAIRLRGMKVIGNTCIDLDANVIHYWDGTSQPLTATRSALLRMLADAAPKYMLTKENICQTIWQRDAKDGQALYNVAVSELRGYLIAPDDALTLTTVPKVGIQVTVDHTKLHPLRKLHYWKYWIK